MTNYLTVGRKQGERRATVGIVTRTPRAVTTRIIQPWRIEQALESEVVVIDLNVYFDHETKLPVRQETVYG